MEQRIGRCHRYGQKIDVTVVNLLNLKNQAEIRVHQLLEQQAVKYSVLVTLFRRGNAVFASFRSRNGEALKVAEKFQGGGHANAAGAILPKSVRNISDGVEYLRQVLNPKNETQQTRLNSLESLFAGIEAEQKK